MTITPKTLSQLPAATNYIPEDVLLIIRNGQFYRLNELPQGIQGEPGLPGENGLPATFRRDGGFLQWKLSGEVDWINLVPLADIKGDSGETIELQVTATHIQYRVVGSVSWIDLVPLASIKGEQGLQGLQGEQGLQGLPGSSGSAIFGNSGDLYNDTDNPIGTIVLADISAVEYFYTGTSNIYVEFIGSNIQVDLKTNYGDVDISVKGSEPGLSSRTIDVGNDGSFLRISANSRITVSRSQGFSPLLVTTDSGIASVTVQPA